MAAGHPVPPGGEALNALFENSDPPLCFCAECKKQGLVRRSDLLTIGLVFDLQSYRTVSKSLLANELRFEYDVGMDNGRRNFSYSTADPYCFQLCVGDSRLDMLTRRLVTIDQLWEEYGALPRCIGGLL